MSALEFQINLSGNLTTALTDAGKAFGATGDGAKKAKHEFELFEGEIGKLGGEMGGFGFNLQAFAKGGSIFTFDLAEGLKTAYEGVEKLVDKFAELTKELIKTAGSTQDLDLAIKLNVGEEQAKKIDELGESFQRTTRFSSEQMKRALLPLVKEGVGDTGTLDTIATIATDLAARNAGGISDVQQSIQAFAGIFQRGRLKPAQLAQFGIQANDYFNELAKSLGTTSDNAQKMAKKGKVSQDKLAQIAVQMIATRQGGAIGQPSLDAAQTMGATLERLSNLGENLFKRIAEGPGMKAIQDALDKFITTMQGPDGDKLMSSIDNLLKKVGEFLTPERISGFVDTLTSGFAKAFDWVSKIVQGLTTALNAFNLVSAQQEMAQAVMFGSKEEKVAAARNLVEARNALATQMSANIPKMAAGGIVHGPTLALIGEAGPEAVVPLSDPGLNPTSSLGGRLGGRSVEIQFGDINIVVPAATDPREAGIQAGQEFRSELKKHLDELSWVFGGSTQGS